MSAARVARRPVRRGQSPSTGEAIAEYLADLAARRQRDGLISPRTVGSYETALRTLLDEATPLSVLDTKTGAARLRKAFTDRWDSSATSTWNARRAAVVSAVSYWRMRGWLTGDPLDGIPARRAPTPKPRARSRTRIAALLAEQSHGLRERTLWSMLYSSTARAEEVLSLDVRDLDVVDGYAEVIRKGGKTDAITWDRATTSLIVALVDGRSSGPVFLSTAGAGRNRLSYRQALDLFKAATGGWTLHDLRHSGLTHRSEDGMSAPMLMAKSGHRDIRSLARYARPSIEAVRRWEDEHEAGRR
ncbi:MAG: tyrosine-type recombinase/integrase [Umezawaea sp.]